ncbi:endoribonuclease dicer homolog 3a [Phtheirospermum japonicum]|uniref:Endoribonuclease dicer homolog 3a n=1 Tax=Phtheirospermum japonicum TaxID=374723 RepID=A0A830CK38_9LAMI|nr:endoribonuclease dicer homolog 3a [Phtheirospermum japonicum]
MEDYYHKSTNRPKIFGMTAPQMIRKGIPSIKDSRVQGECCEVYKESVVQYGNFLQEVLSIIEGSHGMEIQKIALDILGTIFVKNWIL